MRTNSREAHRGQQLCSFPYDNPALQVLEGLERDIEKVSTAACRIEDTHCIEPCKELTHEPSSLPNHFGAILLLLLITQTSSDVIARDKLGHIIAKRCPLALQGLNQDRMNDTLDRRTVSVVSTELTALVRIEAALKQRAEHCRLDLRPIKKRYLSDNIDLLCSKRKHIRTVKQAAVKPLDRQRTEGSTWFGRHEPKQFRELGSENGRLLTQVPSQVSDEAQWK